MVKLDYRKVYILGNTRYLFRYKIGIAKNVNKRIEQIESTLKGNTYEIFSISVFHAEHVETFLHSIYKPLRAKMYGDGRTEWFYFLLPVSPIIVLICIFVLQILGVVGVVWLLCGGVWGKLA